MPKLISPTGVRVSVSDEKAESLKSSGYRPVPPKKAEKVPDLTPKGRTRGKTDGE